MICSFDNAYIIFIDRLVPLKDVAELVTAEFNKIRKQPKEDKWEVEGREIFKRKVQEMVDAGKTLAFVLPAFPFKSTNHVEKVMGPKPDVGERLAVATMHQFAKKVLVTFCRTL